MTKPFLTCTNCGQKSTDTKRCQHCGRAFGRAPQDDDAGAKRNWFPLLAGLGLVAVTGYGLQQWWQRPAVAPSVVVPDTTTVTLPAETAAVTPEPAPQKVAPVDTPRTAVPVPVEPRKEPAPPVVDTPASAPASQPKAIDVERQRYAKTWANVRAERNSTAQVLQVLDRGEIVAIDSLVDGWYRVTTDRPVVGYVDQAFLDTLPPGPP